MHMNKEINHLSIHHEWMKGYTDNRKIIKGGDGWIKKTTIRVHE